MVYDLGKVVKFDGYYGEIVGSTGKYIFLSKDIKDGKTLKEGDYVTFRGEIVGELKKAFFISLVTNKKSLELNKE